MFCKKLTVVIARMSPCLRGRQMCSQSRSNKNYEQARPADVDDGGITSASQSAQSAAEVAAEDANSMPPPLTPFFDGHAGMGEEPPIVGDGGHCVADMGTSTTTHAGDDQSCLRSSNIVSKMKKLPRLQKPSRVWGSPYTNPTREIKGGRKGLQSTAIVNTGSGHRSPSIVHGDVVNNEDVISVVPIAVVPVEGEVDAHVIPDAALKDDVPDTSIFGLSPYVPAPRTRGTSSKFVICEEGAKPYLTWTLSPAKLGLLVAIRARCKGLKDDQRNFDLPKANEKHVNAEFLKRLINVVPTRGPADRPGRYCIGSFACEHKRYCRMSIFLDCHDQLSTVNDKYVTLLQGLLSKPEHTARDIWKMLKAQKDSNLCYMLTTDSSLYTTLYNANGTVPENVYYLVGSKVAIGLALIKLAEFTDVLRWEMEHADCPQQDK
ncbi:LOW QUALITY PROTEIN: hypothetical protein Cgig2_012306 [Carnegiea gigantea]|uniref:Uncharacterized protein n=1 Tax=Carnegiea gigantea TaxID=171969 RepID=A0A9Q1GSY9_9CARY|nr:LOW QUALITY PROTEIN: hypothetical protein Cgig2_012306 [Carnegiea gigantea]